MNIKTYNIEEIVDICIEYLEGLLKCKPIYHIENINIVITLAPIHRPYIENIPIPIPIPTPTLTPTPIRRVIDTITKRAITIEI